MFSKDQKDTSKVIAKTNRDIAAGDSPPYTDPALPHTIDEAIQLESEVFTQSQAFLKENLGKDGMQDALMSAMDNASGAVQSIHDIVQIKIDQQKTR